MAGLNKCCRESESNTPVIGLDWSVVLDECTLLYIEYETTRVHWDLVGEVLNNITMNLSISICNKRKIIFVNFLKND